MSMNDGASQSDEQNVTRMARHRYTYDSFLQPSSTTGSILQDATQVVAAGEDIVSDEQDMQVRNRPQ